MLAICHWAWSLPFNIVCMPSETIRENYFFSTSGCQVESFTVRDSGLGPVPFQYRDSSGLDLGRPCTYCKGSVSSHVCPCCCAWKALFIWHLTSPLTLTVCLPPFLNSSLTPEFDRSFPSRVSHFLHIVQLGSPC